MKRKLLLLWLPLIILISSIRVMAIETVMGGIDSNLRSNNVTKEGNTVIVAYAFNYRGDNIKSNLDIELDYDNTYLRLHLLTGVLGEPAAACQMLNSKKVTCYNVPSNNESNINLVFKIVRDFDTDKQITATLKSKDKDKPIIFDQAVTVTKIPVVKEKTPELPPITLEEESVTLKPNDVYNIKYQLGKEVATEKVTFKSTKENIVTVSPEGSLRAIAPGEATIVLSVKDYKKEFNVIVEGKKEEEKPKCLVEKINVASSVSLKQSEVRKLDISLEPGCSLMSELEYEMTNTNIAWIDANGYVIGLHPGKTTLKIKSKNKEVAVAVNVLAGKVIKQRMHPLLVIILTLIVEAIIYFIWSKFRGTGNFITRKKTTTTTTEDNEETTTTTTEETVDVDDEYFDGIDLDV